MAKESAEEKLLKMMRKPASSVAVKSSLQAPLKKKFKFTFSIGVLNIFLFLGVIACCVVLVFELLSGSSLLNHAVVFPRESKTDASLSDIALPSIPNVDYYLQTVNERNIFKPYVPKVSKLATMQDLQQRMSRYKLVGIAWLDLPETASVMINDTEKNRILFLKKGEQLDGGIFIKTIYTDRAVFGHDTEETTIKL